MKTAPRLSVCMIVKNEAHQLSEILSQCKSFADEIIVVDTGSKDNTKEVALCYTDEVFDFEWCDDFSAARNYSLRKATGDYALIVDADDRLTSEDQERIDKLRQYMDGERMFNFALHNVDFDGQRSGEGFYQPRCFPIRDDVYYEGRVHNQIAPSIERADLKPCCVNINIDHYGYADPTLTDAKRTRTTNILKLEHRENPRDGRVNMYLGLHYERQGDLQKAKEHFEISLEEFEEKYTKKPLGLYESYCGLVRVCSELGQREEAQSYFQKLVAFTSGAPSKVQLGVTAIAEQYGFYEEYGITESEPIPELDVALVGNNDWANVGYEFAKALRSVGVNAEMLIGNYHAFGYPQQGKLISSVKRLTEYLEKAGIIQFMHSQFPADIALPMNGKPVYVFHGGTVYRNNAESFNAFFNEIVTGTLIQSSDLFGLGAKNEHWVLPCIDASNYQPIYDRQDPEKLIIGHFHWNREGKVSAILDEAVEKLEADPETKGRFEVRMDARRVSWRENISRIAACDLVVDQLKGLWGVTSLEAAALGKVPVSGFDALNRYETEYGTCGLAVVKSKDSDDLAQVLKTFIVMPDNDLRVWKLKARQWVKNLHSYECIGTKLKEIYGL